MKTRQPISGCLVYLEQEMEDLKLYNRKRLAELLGVTTRTIDNMIRDGELPAPDYHIARRRMKIWKQSSILAALDASNCPHQKNR